MTFRKLTYNLATGAITGTLGNKIINARNRPAEGTKAPPPGDYELQPPVRDPIYGIVALMVPATGAVSQAHAITVKQTEALATGQRLHKPFDTRTTSAMTFQKYSAAQGTANETPQSYVLSARPMLGENSLIVTVGFADLMDALQAAGGAPLTVL